MAYRFLRAPIARSNIDDHDVVESEKIIHNVSVVTKGEALGHQLFLDDLFLDQIIELGNSGNDRGLKCRFTHPNMSTDGLGTFLGRVKNLRREGNQVKGDLHLSESADRSPHGQLAQYILDLVREDPEALGISIVYQPDVDEEQRFVEAHTNKRTGKFLSPDPLNKRNLRHARAVRVRAADIVDTPSANPSGMFCEGSELASRAEAILKYAFRICDELPDELGQLIVDPDRAREFCSTFIERYGNELREILRMNQDVPRDDMGAEVEPESSPVNDTGTATEPAEAPAGSSENEPQVETTTESGELDDATSHLSYEQFHQNVVSIDKTFPGTTDVVLGDADAWKAGAYHKNGSIPKLIHHKKDGTVVLSLVMQSAARIPTLRISDDERKRVQEHLGRHYEEFDEIAPWERSADAWEHYVRFCSAAKAHNGLSDIDLVRCLRMVGFAREAAALGIKEEDYGRGDEHGEFEEDDIDPAEIEQAVHEIMKQRLDAAKGRLPS